MIKTVRNKLQRLRHFRGHGVHSPYIYRIVREVFMRRTLYNGVNTDLLLALADLSVDINISRRTLVELHNLFIHCDYKSFGINPDATLGVDYVLVTKNITNTLKQATESGTTVVLLGCSRSNLLALELEKRHNSTYVDKGDYVLIFNNQLPKQHYIL